MWRPVSGAVDKSTDIALVLKTSLALLGLGLRPLLRLLCKE